MSGVVFTETIRRHLVSPGYWTAVMAICVTAGFSGAFGAPPQAWEVFLTLMALVLGCRLIGPEFSSGTLQLILSKPVNRSAYLLSRFAGVIVALCIATAAPLLVDVICRKVFANAANDWKAIAASAVNSTLGFVLLCALLALLGSLTRSYSNVGIYILLQIAMGLLIGSLRALMRSLTGGHLTDLLRAHPGFVDGLATVQQNLFPSAPAGADARFVALVSTNSVVALLLACLIFRRREVPYGAD